jgi:hypothetical protein
VDRTFKAGHVPPVAVGGITRLASYFAVASAPDGSVVIAGTAVDGATIPGGEHPVGYSAIAVARLTATCPIRDVKPPSLELKCSAGCRRVVGTALDDPVGGGVRRVLLGIERIAGKRCAAWNGRRFVPLACAEAATRLVATRVVDGSFRTQPLGAGHYVVRARAVDRAGNDAEVVARINR